MRVWVLSAAFGLLVVSAGFAAGPGNPQQIIDERIAGMKTLPAALKAAREATDPAVTKAELGKALAFAKTIVSRFPKGTGPGDAGVTKTRALPAIWTEPAKFEESANGFVAALEKAIAAAGDSSKLDAALGDVKKSCGGCHNSYRGPEN